MTTITRQIVGYDPNTERVAFEHYIPVSKWTEVLSFVRKNDDDPEYLYNYPIDLSIANDIMGLMNVKAAQNLNYFLECEAAV